MSNAAITADSLPEDLDLYRLRDDLAASYNPANGHERMLLNAIVQAWQRLQRAQETEARYCAGRDMVEVLTTKLKEFKAVTRWVTDCERAWRHAVNMLQQSQRRRQRETLASPNMRRGPLKFPDAAPPNPVQNPEPPAAAHTRRE